jgi:NAD(P)-dependent dehydrogenase (short-subunit alcohol dehydrogenase family)
VSVLFSIPDVAHEPIRSDSNATAANAGIEGFAAAAAIELRRGVRINAVCPTIVTESSDACLSSADHIGA